MDVLDNYVHNIKATYNMKLIDSKKVTLYVFPIKESARNYFHSIEDNDRDRRPHIDWKWKSYVRYITIIIQLGQIKFTFIYSQY